MIDNIQMNFGSGEHRVDGLKAVVSKENDDVSDQFAVKEITMPESAREELREYLKSRLVAIEEEIELIKTRKTELEKFERTGESNQYIKEMYRRLIYRFLYSKLLENESVDLVGAYHELENQTPYSESHTEFVHQFGTCIAMVIRLIEIVNNTKQILDMPTSNREFLERL